MKTIIANFKSHKSLREYTSWIKEFEETLPIRSSPNNATLILCPAFPALELFSSLVEKRSSNVFLGLQDLSPFPSGAYTGAVSTKNVEDLSIHYAILGHSERRHYFKETSQDVANKVREALTASITPILCVTESEIEHQANALDDNQRTKVFVAFEPVEHIGTGESDSLEHIVSVKEKVEKWFGDVPFIYGGSVSETTNEALLTSSAIDGFLVGSASLQADNFTRLIQKISS